MKTIRFTYRSGRNSSGYYCSEPGDQDGEYVPAGTARQLLAAIQNIIDAWDANDSHGVREEIERSRPVLDRAKGETNV